MENLLFVINSCKRCQRSINYLKKHNIDFELVNVIEEDASRYNHILIDQPLPLLLREATVYSFEEILRL